MIPFKTVVMLSSAGAGLCVLGLPLWILGVPGTENEYARGWRMGLQVLLVLPCLFVLLFAPYWLFHNRVVATTREQ